MMFSIEASSSDFPIKSLLIWDDDILAITI